MLAAIVSLQLFSVDYQDYVLMLVFVYFVGELFNLKNDPSHLYRCRTFRYLPLPCNQPP